MDGTISSAMLSASMRELSGVVIMRADLSLEGMMDGTMDGTMLAASAR